MKAKNVLILGDSYSTFAGYIPEGNAIYYSTNERPETDVRRVEETWWYSLCKEEGLNVVLNESWSGAPFAFWGWYGMDTSKTSSFVYRLEKLIDEGFFKNNDVDTIFVLGGTNDSWIDTELGEAKYSDWTREDFYTVCPAITYFASKLKETKPDANIIFLINTGLKPKIAETIREACDRYDMKYLELSDIDKSHGHPTIKGMSQIKEQLKAFMHEN